MFERNPDSISLPVLRDSPKSREGGFTVKLALILVVGLLCFKECVGAFSTAQAGSDDMPRVVRALESIARSMEKCRQ